jgi:hypothetical protein
MSSPEQEVENYEKLLRAIYDRPIHERPRLGNPPAHLFEERVSPSRTAGRLQVIRGILSAGRPLPPGVLEDYFEEFLEALETVRISNPAEEEPPIDEKVLSSITNFLPYRDEFIDVTILLGRYLADASAFEQVASFFERAARLTEPPHNTSHWYDFWYDNYRFLIWELFLYWIAGLIHSRRYDVAASFLARRYYVTTRQMSGLKTYGFFQNRLQTLEDFRKQRLGLRYISVTAAIFRDRASHKMLTMAKMMETDMVLFIRSLMDAAEDRTVSSWHPKTVIFAGYGQSMELFERAASRTQAVAVATLLGQPSPEALRERLLALMTEQSHQQLFGHMAVHWDVSLPALLNVERIATLP